MKERLLVYRRQNIGNVPKGGEKVSEALDTKGDLYEVADECGDDICKVPPKGGKSKVEEGKEVEEKDSN